jgi:TusA-related sulfurtransferase
MRYVKTIALLVSLLLATNAVAQDKTKTAQSQEKEKKAVPAAHETKTARWFDMDHCAFCKCFGEQKGLMENIKWETHELDNGMMYVAVVPENMKDAMVKCEKAMKEVAKKMESGESLEICRHCASWGELIKAGAKEAKINTAAGAITLLTSDKPEVVKMIHEHAKTTQKELESMVAAKSNKNK